MRQRPKLWYCLAYRRKNFCAAGVCRVMCAANVDVLPDAASLPATNIRVPRHVVYRRLPSETVVFNLQTGRYHGLNPTAGSMLEALEQSSCLREAAVVVAAKYDRPQAKVERDLCELCDDLLARGLIEFDGDTPN